MSTMTIMCAHVCGRQDPRVGGLVGGRRLIRAVHFGIGYMKVRIELRLLIFVSGNNVMRHMIWSADK